jgi:hypothetical protein
VANICFLDDRETYLDIGLDDGTGRIKARRWNNNREGHVDVFHAPYVFFLFNSSNSLFRGLSLASSCSNFPYMRVVGGLEQFKNRNLIKVIDIRPVFSVHEPYYHVLQAIHDTLLQERGPPVSQGV